MNVHQKFIYAYVHQRRVYAAISYPLRLRFPSIVARDSIFLVHVAGIFLPMCVYMYIFIYMCVCACTHTRILYSRRAVSAKGTKAEFAYIFFLKTAA